MAKTSKFVAIATSKCPKCRRGDVFSGTLYGFNFQETNERCSHCGMKFEIEPGYFYGAMYVSYAFVVAEMLNVGLLTFLITGNDSSPWLYISTIIGAILLTISALLPCLDVFLKWFFRSYNHSINLIVF